MRYLIEIAVALLAMILQVVVGNFVSIVGATPDLVLIYLIWVVLRRGQLHAELVGFVLGLFLDVLSSGTPGAHALSYTIVGFLLGYFFNEDQIEQRLRNWPFLLFVFVGSVVNNLIYYFLFTQGTGINFIDYATMRGGLVTIYTTIVAVVPMFYQTRRPLY